MRSRTFLLAEETDEFVFMIPNDKVEDEDCPYDFCLSCKLSEQNNMELKMDDVEKQMGNLAMLEADCANLISSMENTELVEEWILVDTGSATHACPHSCVEETPLDAPGRAAALLTATGEETKNIGRRTVHYKFEVMDTERYGYQGQVN